MELSDKRAIEAAEPPMDIRSCGSGTKHAKISPEHQLSKTAAHRLISANMTSIEVSSI
jgi:hypothetical protein